MTASSNHLKPAYKSVSWKYCLSDNYPRRCRVPDHVMCDGEWFSIVPGSILIYAGYAWDGASGPTIDSENSMAASLVHDAFYQAIRTGQAPGSFRRRADGIFRDILKEDGMSFARRWLWYFGVRLFGGKYA